MLTRAVAFIFIFAIAIISSLIWGERPFEVIDIVGKGIVATFACILLHVKWKQGDKEARAHLSSNDVEDTFS